MADDVGQVLDEGAAPGDVEDLSAATDAEQRQVAGQGGLGERQLGGVAVGPYTGRGGVHRLAVRSRVDVGAAGQDHAVEPVEQPSGSAAPCGGTSSGSRRPRSTAST